MIYCAKAIYTDNQSAIGRKVKDVLPIVVAACINRTIQYIVLKKHKRIHAWYMCCIK